jgi:hypothetical protein
MTLHGQRRISGKLLCGGGSLGTGINNKLRSSCSLLTRSLIAKCSQEELFDLNFTAIGGKYKHLLGQGPLPVRRRISGSG